MSRVSDEQFAHLANTGGASRRVITREEAPKSGVYVSTPDLEQRYDHNVTAKDVAEHRQRILNTRGAKGVQFQGGWPEDGRVYLDHSINAKHLSNGFVLARPDRWDQKSMYDADKGVYHSTSRRAPRQVERASGIKRRGRDAD